ncbi:hypothetical protein [Agathobaculum sp.]|uniref:hypothetical protein n=1 Tax=Agathobaculum sp. TaxID=2048138 RepID=UPI002A804909|nr:hypothetical protein [Agathobaculum sp.]MDY3618463.1 hypothetical protein [Agathobaculum sp.]
MDTNKAQAFLARLDETLTAQRHRLIGGGIRLLPPAHTTTRAEQMDAVCSLAARLTFCCAAAYPEMDAAELRSCRSRLAAAITFLLCECAERDCTFEKLLHILALESCVLNDLLASAYRTPHRFRHFYRAALHSESVPDFELALVLFLMRENLLDDVPIG